MKKWILRMVVLSPLLILLSIHLLDIAMHQSDEEAVQTLTNAGLQASVTYVEWEGYRLRCVGDSPSTSDSTLIVFVHGAPGSWDAFEQYLLDSIFHQGTRVVAYDRPSYGNTGGRAVISIERQVEALMAVVRSFDLPHVVLVGHSYGGPIVGHALARYAEEVDRAVMIAPLNDPQNEPIFWFAYFSKWMATRWLLPHSFQVAGAEKFSHSKSLQQIEDSWSNIVNPILHIHGTTDALAPPRANITFSQSHITDEVLQLEVMEGAGHLVLWDDYTSVRQLISTFIEQ